MSFVKNIKWECFCNSSGVQKSNFPARPNVNSTSVFSVCVGDPFDSPFFTAFVRTSFSSFPLESALIEKFEDGILSIGFLLISDLLILPNSLPWQTLLINLLARWSSGPSGIVCSQWSIPKLMIFSCRFCRFTRVSVYINCLHNEACSIWVFVNCHCWHNGRVKVKASTRGWGGCNLRVIFGTGVRVSFWKHIPIPGSRGVVYGRGGGHFKPKAWTERRKPRGMVPPAHCRGSGNSPAFFFLKIYGSENAFQAILKPFFSIFYIDWFSPFNSLSAY